MFVFLFVVSLLLLNSACVFSSEEVVELIENREWIPSREAYGRDFENWFGWVPWGADKKKVPTVKERLKILETRLNVLFELVRCESYKQIDCTPYRNQAETVFNIPYRGDLSPPTKIGPSPTTPAESTTTVTTTTTTSPPSTSSVSPSTEAPTTTTSAPTTTA